MLTRVSKFFLLAIVVELCVGGGGRFTAVGPVSLRMILFAIAIVLTLAMLVTRKKISPSYWKLLGAFTAVLAVGIVIGLVNNSPGEQLWEDVKPLLYFFMLPFFALTIERKEVESISEIFKKGSIFLAVALFSLLILIHTGLIPFLTFYQLTHDTQELFYRGELSFFHKSFLFFGIGSIFFFFTGGKNKSLAIAFLVAAIVFSVTRGLIFSLAVTFSIYFLHEKRNYYPVAGALIAFVILVWGNKATMSLSKWMDSNKHQTSFSESNPKLFGDRKYSDDGRVAQWNEVRQAVTPSTAIIGHGFGQGIPARPVHMEIAYLEVFHKQGIIGLAFWAAFSVMIFLSYQKSNRDALSKAFLLSALFVFVESATNQYFNNPIGLSVLLLSLVSLDKLKQA